MDERITLEFDGGSRGNPGPAGIGVVLRAADRTPLAMLGRCIGRATNNVAEYKALITALRKAKELGARRIIVRGDSELIVKQMRGEYRVKHPDLQPLYKEAQDLMRAFDESKIEHNLRHHNTLADRLANLAMDRKADVEELPDDEDAPAAGGVGGPARNALDSVDAPAAVAPKAGERFACPRCGCTIALLRPSSIRPHQLKPFACQCGMKMSGTELRDVGELRD
jgi:ribonuclease HI